MTRRENDEGSLSFKDRSLSKAAARELLSSRKDRELGGILDTAVVRIKLAKTAKAELATEAQLARRHSIELTVGGRNAKPGGLTTEKLRGWRKPREVA